MLLPTILAHLILSTLSEIFLGLLLSCDFVFPYLLVLKLCSLEVHVFH